MAPLTPSRGMVAAAIVAVTAAATLYQTGDAGGALIALVGGLAAVVFAVTMRPVAAVAAAGTARVDPDALIAHAADAIDDPVILIDRDVVAHANAAARALLGGHIVGQDVRLALRHPAAAERLAREAGDAAQIVGLGARDQHWEMRVGRVDERRRLAHFIDRTGQLATERMRVDFVANASHELRTPLASILGFVETLGDEAGEDRATRQRFLKLMDDEARRMGRLVDDLISLSRIEAGKFRIPDQPVDLGALVREVCGELSAGFGSRGADLAVDLDDVAPILADRAQISQLLHNLVGNALKYGRAGTPVTIRLQAVDAAMIALSVGDTGEGIAPQHLPRLTERFYRVDMGRSRSMGGTGLGLAIVKHIVERHRGRLDIASTLGVGTSVTVLLPRGGGAVIKA